MSCEHQVFCVNNIHISSEVIRQDSVFFLEKKSTDKNENVPTCLKTLL